MFFKKDKKNNKNIDFIMILVVLALCIYGIIMLYSASQLYSTNMYNDEMYLARKQAIIMIAGIIISFIVSNIDYKIYYHTSKLLYIIAFMFLIATTLATTMSRGVNRWINFNLDMYDEQIYYQKNRFPNPSSLTALENLRFHDKDAYRKEAEKMVQEHSLPTRQKISQTLKIKINSYLVIFEIKK